MTDEELTRLCERDPESLGPYGRFDAVVAFRRELPRLLAEKAALRKERDRLHNLALNYGNKLDEWREMTGCSCPSAAAGEIASLKADTVRTCPEHGCPLVRIRHAKAHACPECLCRERDQEILANETLTAEVVRLQAIVNGLADRVAAQSELLSRKAEAGQ
jgi:hypothetical protein